VSLLVVVFTAGMGTLAAAPGDFVAALDESAVAPDDSMAVSGDLAAAPDDPSLQIPAPNVPDDSVHIQIDGILMDSADTPFIENGRVLIPLRAVVEYLSGTIHWYPDEQQIIGFRGARGFDLTIGASRANLSDGSVYELDVPAKIVASRTYVPLRFVSEAMGCQIEWDGEERTVRIATVMVEAKKEVEELAAPTLLMVTTDQNTGSGFFYSKDGQVITTADLVEEAEWIKVTTGDGTEYMAEPLVVDHVFNLAKLRVKREAGEIFPVFRYFDDFLGLVGDERVFALGSPLLMDSPASAGMISAKSPSSGQPGSINTYRVTAAITEDNKGGPLVKENGALIGVNCYAEQDGKTVSYSIPVEYVFEMRNR
jgi:S1-C subfamily serine protease